MDENSGILPGLRTVAGKPVQVGFNGGRLTSECRDLYERVESVLAGDIADGSLSPETQFPTEEGLVERFKVSRTTVRKAIQNLVERGLVEVRRGKAHLSPSRRSRRS
jgi:DNA-binding transcriptional regulator YhcF (GntR family)